ncbi:histidinol-phosphatase [Evansella sp. LMS18]|uniref:histidinol-phosphatase n=1 Tax=Evansella sp. LMS18 TaxID=2924033 RepID=UPI0020D1F48A|nr:histidinol-phosphatase [Evansella sp. LMS18]UTR09586.1 histidinol-phosphatase [Evansella sp. LMS18]
MRTDYHNHLEKGTLTFDYLLKFIKEAERKGIAELGISEHAYHFYETENILSNPWVNDRRWYKMEEYVSLFKEAREKGFNVKMSIEMDYTPGKHKEMAEFINSYKFDYVIGSVHWNGDFGVDLAEFRTEWEKRDLKKIYSEYYDQIVTLAQSNLFDIVGHLDLVKIFRYIPEDQDFLFEQYERATDALAASDTCIELSTAGLRKPVEEMYPHPDLLKMCCEKGIPLVLSSDAHEPDHVGYEYDKAVSLAKEAGYTAVTVFNQRDRTSAPLE